MSRRTFLCALSGSLLAGARLAAAVTPHHDTRTIGWLSLGQQWDMEAFRSRLRELGWVEGRDVAIEARFADNDRERLPALAADLVERKVDVIVTQTTLAAHVAKQATESIPIVMAGCNDPVLEGLVASLARPGKNITGIMYGPRGFGFKIVQLLIEAAPQATRIAVLIRETDGDTSSWRAPAKELGIVLAFPQVESRMEIPAALEAALRWRANALYVPPTSLNNANNKLIAEFARVHRLPAIGGARNFPLEGGLMSYFASWREIRRQAADYVDKVLRGAQPGDLPIEHPAKFELVLNLRTARELGLAIPASLRLRADELIQ